MNVICNESNGRRLTNNNKQKNFDDGSYRPTKVLDILQ